jgi:Porin PorA
MRRVVWSLLIGLGVFFIVLAVMLRFYLPGVAVKAPLNEYTKSTLQGTDVSYFSAAQLEELTGVTMRATNTVEGDVAAAKAAGASHVAVWRSFTAVEDVTNRQPFSYDSQMLAFDRSNGLLLNCCGNFIGSDHNLHLSGQGYLWPFSAGQHSYQVYETTLKKPVVARFVGTGDTDGTSTYRYAIHVPPTQIGTQTLPAALLGLPGTEVTLAEFYAVDKTYWVDPVTGAPLQVTETERLTLRDSSGATQLVLFDGTLSSTPASVRDAVGLDGSYLLKIHLLEIILPIIGLVAGIILIVVGLVLSRTRPDDESGDFEQAGAPVHEGTAHGGTVHEGTVHEGTEAVDLPE